MSSPSTALGQSDTVDVVVRPEGRTNQPLVLQVGSRYFAIPDDGGSGVITVRDGAPSYEVRVLTLSCQSLITFEAVAGTAHVIRIGRDGSFEVEQVSVVNAGPRLIERLPICRQPLYNLGQTTGLLIGGLAAVALILLLAVFAFRYRRQKR